MRVTPPLPLRVYSRESENIFEPNSSTDLSTGALHLLPVLVTLCLTERADTDTRRLLFTGPESRNCSIKNLRTPVLVDLRSNFFDLW